MPSWAGLRPQLANNGSSDTNGGGANTGMLSEASFVPLIRVVAATVHNQALRAAVAHAISRLETAHAVPA